MSADVEASGEGPEAQSVAACSISEAVHCAVSLAQNGDVEEAAEVLRCECEHAPAEALRSAHLALLQGLLQQERVDSAGDLALQLLREDHLPMSELEAVLRALAHAQHHTRGAEVLRAACRAGVTPGDAAFNSIVDSAVRARSYSDAWDTLELLLERGRRADKYFVSILTKSLEASGDRRWVRRGIGLVERFIDQQREDVDEIVFNSLLNVLGHVGDMQRLQQTLAKMNEYCVPPSAVTYGTVVKAYGRNRDINAVLQVWEDMRTRCLGVNPVTCGCVLDACVKCGHLDRAMTIFQQMKAQGLHKNTVLYATLIKGLAKVRDLVAAVHLYQEMRLESVPCNLVTFNSLMDVCVRCGDLQTAAYFLDQMMKMGIEADLITFSTLIKGYSHTGEVHKALALLTELKARGLKCDEIMYNSLIDGCAKANRVPEGLAVFEDMLQSRVAPSNITFSILVKLHFEAGQVATAFRLVEDMASRYHCVPSRIVYTVLLRCCAQHGGAALARGAELLAELARRRSSKLPDAGMVSALLGGCAQHADFDTGLRLVHELLGPGGLGPGPGPASAAAAAARRASGHSQRETPLPAAQAQGHLAPLPVEGLRQLLEALGSHQDSRGAQLLERLGQRLPPAQLAALRAAFAEAQRWSAQAQVQVQVQVQAHAKAQAPASARDPAAPTSAASPKSLGSKPPGSSLGTGPLVRGPAVQASNSAPQVFLAGHCRRAEAEAGAEGAEADAEAQAWRDGLLHPAPGSAPLRSLAETAAPVLAPRGSNSHRTRNKENALPSTQFMKENINVGGSNSGNSTVKHQVLAKPLSADRRLHSSTASGAHTT